MLRGIFFVLITFLYRDPKGRLIANSVPSLTSWPMCAVKTTPSHAGNIKLSDLFEPVHCLI